MLTLLLACAPAPDATGPAAESPPVLTPSPIDHETVTADWTVDCDGTGDFTTIGEAIDAASSGQVIDVSACTYAESIDFGGKSLTLRARGDVEETIIDAPGGSVITAISGEGEGTAVIGFTLTGGNTSVGPAVDMDFSALLLQDCVITGNRGSYLVYGASSDLELDNVSFVDNQLTSGVLVYSDRGSLLADNTTFACDRGTYGALVEHGAAYFDRSSFECTGGYATYWNHTVGRIKRSVVTGSVAVESEYDHYDDAVIIENTFVKGTVAADYGSLTIRNSIVDGPVDLTNIYTLTTLEGSIFTGTTCAVRSDLIVIDADTADTAPGVMADPFTVRNNLFWGVGSSNCSGDDYVGTNGNLDGDPLFADWAGNDWHLSAGSPAINAGPSDPGYEDVDGTLNDIGVYGGHGSMDGGW